MNVRPQTLGLFGAGLVFAGCGPMIPDGPNGGVNRFALSVDGEQIPFDEARISGRGSNDQLTVSFAASGNEEDELFATLLSVTFRRFELEALVGAGPQKIATHIVPVTNNRGLIVERAVPVPGTSPALSSIQYSISRGSFFESVSRNTQGSLQISFFDHFSILGSLTLEIDRATLASGALNHTIDANFDVPIPLLP